MKKKDFIVRYKTDVLFALLSIMLAMFLIDGPGTIQKAGVQGGQAPPPGRPTTESSRQAEKEAMHPRTNLYASLEKKNIFSEDGSYEKPKELKKIPEIAYNLLAVLLGKEKRAIMREYTGTMVSVKVGDKLIDDSVVTDIDNLTVRTKKQKTVKEYRIFDVKPKK